jgi:HEAT repeat protein
MRTKADIAKLKEKKNLYGLINALKDPDADIRSQVAEGLGELNDEAATDALIEALNDDHWSVRRNAAWALGEVSSARAVLYLIGAFRKTWEGIDAYCAEALVKIGRPAVKPLLRVLDGPDLNTRYWSIEALGQIGDARAIEPLIALLSDRDAIIRYSSTKALGAIADSKAFDPLIKALQDPSDMVKRRAQKSIRKLVLQESAQKIDLQAGKLIKLIAVVETDDGTVKKIEIDLKSPEENTTHE